MDSPRVVARSPSPGRRMIATFDNLSTPGPVPNLTGARAKGLAYDSPRSPRSPRILTSPRVGGMMRPISPPPSLQPSQRPPPPAYTEAVAVRSSSPPPLSESTNSSSPRASPIPALTSVGEPSPQIPPHVQSTMAKMEEELAQLQDWKRRWESAKAFDVNEYNHLLPVPVREHINVLNQDIARQREMLTNELNDKAALQRQVDDLRDRLRLQALQHSYAQRSPSRDVDELLTKIDRLEVELMDSNAKLANQESMHMDRVESLEKDLDTARRREKSKSMREVRAKSQSPTGGSEALQKTVEQLTIDLIDTQVAKDNMESAIREELADYEKKSSDTKRKLAKYDTQLRSLRLFKSQATRDLNTLKLDLAYAQEEKHELLDALEGLAAELEAERGNRNQAESRLEVEIMDATIQREALQRNYEDKVEELEGTLRKSALKEKTGRKRAMSSRVSFSPIHSPQKDTIAALTVELCDERERRDALERSMEARLETMRKESAASHQKELTGRRRAKSMSMNLNKQVDDLTDQVDELRGQIQKGTLPRRKGKATLQRADCSALSVARATEGGKRGASRINRNDIASLSTMHITVTPPLGPPTPGVDSPSGIVLPQLGRDDAGTPSRF